MTVQTPNRSEEDNYTTLSTFGLLKGLLVKLLVVEAEAALDRLTVSSIQHSLRASSAQLFQALKRSLTWGRSGEEYDQSR